MFNRFLPLILDNTSEEQTRSDFKLFIVIAFLLSIFLSGVAIKNSVYLFQDIYLDKSGNVTNGQIIERVREGTNRGRATYYLKYKFRNDFSDNVCELDKETRQTPRDKACMNTIRRVIVSEIQYKQAQLNSSISVIYLARNDITRSKVLEYNHTVRAHLWTGVLVPILFALLLFIWSFKSFKKI